jgi:hypothetical protein
MNGSKEIEVNPISPDPDGFPQAAITALVGIVGPMIISFTSLVVSFIGLALGRYSERRAAYRSTLESHLDKLGAAMHQVVATSEKLADATLSKESRANWTDKARIAKQNLEEARLATRYPLWNLRRGLRTIRNLPDWVQHSIRDPERCAAILRKGKHLQRRLDTYIHRAYQSGKEPSRWAKRSIRREVDALKLIHRKRAIPPRTSATNPEKVMS